MDKLKKYQDAIMSVMEDFAAVPFANTPAIEKQIIADRERNAFKSFALVGKMKTIWLAPLFFILKSRMAKFGFNRIGLKSLLLPN